MKNCIYDLQINNDNKFIIGNQRVKTYCLSMIVNVIGLMMLCVFIICQDAIGATYYISPSGSDTNSCTSSQSTSTPKKTFSSGWGCLSAGDTLSVANGTYTSASPPAGKSGASGNPITIQAAFDGEAKISGSIGLKGNSYLTFIGFKVTGASNAIYIESNGTGATSHHNIFQRVGFTCTNVTLNDSTCFGIGDGSHHNLVEDSWGWGGGRYTTMLYGGPGGSPPNLTADNNTIRRVVLRMGPSTSTSGNPQAGLALYYANNNIVENVLVIDSQANSDTSNAAFYLTSHSPPPDVSGNKFFGVIALNNFGIGWYLDHNGTGNNNELRNSVIWASREIGIALYASGTCTGNIIDHVTVGATTLGDGYWSGSCTAVSVKSSIFLNNAGYGVANGTSGSTAENYLDLYANAGGARLRITAGANDITTSPALLYIPRSEVGSSVKGTGDSGTDIGANVTKRYQDGVLTSADLWPWPNEARIKKEMCTDSGITRGFCATGNNPQTGNPITLTSYVWEYFGNSMPSEYLTLKKPYFPSNLVIH